MADVPNVWRRGARFQGSKRTIGGWCPAQRLEIAVCRPSAASPDCVVRLPSCTRRRRPQRQSRSALRQKPMPGAGSDLRQEKPAADGRKPEAQPLVPWKRILPNFKLLKTRGCRRSCGRVRTIAKRCSASWSFPGAGCAGVGRLRRCRKIGKFQHDPACCLFELSARGAFGSGFSALSGKKSKL